MPKPMKRLDREIELSLNLNLDYYFHKILEVTHALNGHKFVVNLHDNSCTCNLWGIVGIHCRHAVLALQYASHKPFF